MTNSESPDSDKAFEDGLRFAQKLAHKGYHKRLIEDRLIEQGYEKMTAFRIANRAFDKAVVDKERTTERNASLASTAKTSVRYTGLVITGFLSSIDPTGILKLLLEPIRRWLQPK